MAFDREPLLTQFRFEASVNIAGGRVATVPVHRGGAEFVHQRRQHVRGRAVTQRQLAA